MKQIQHISQRIYSLLSDTALVGMSQCAEFHCLPLLQNKSVYRLLSGQIPSGLSASPKTCISALFQARKPCSCYISQIMFPRFFQLYLSCIVFYLFFVVPVLLEGQCYPFSAFGNSLCLPRPPSMAQDHAFSLHLRMLL